MTDIIESGVGIVNRGPLDWIGGNGFAINDAHNFAHRGRDRFFRAIKKFTFSEASKIALMTDSKTSEINLISNGNSIGGFLTDSPLFSQSIEHGRIVLSTNGEADEVRTAHLFLRNTLIKNKEYIFSVKYKIKTNSPVFGLYLFDGESDDIENIYMTSPKASDDISDWITASIKFNPYGSCIDSIAVLSNHLAGADNKLIIDTISISESNERWWFDESLIPDNSNVVVYGYGDVGHDFVKQINESIRLNIVGIVDANADKINSELKIHNLNEIKNLSFDYIVIAILNRGIVHSVHEKLRAANVPEHKIIILESIERKQI